VGSHTPDERPSGEGADGVAEVNASLNDLQIVKDAVDSINTKGSSWWKKIWPRKPKNVPTVIEALDEFDNLRYRWLDQRLALRSEYSAWFKWLLTIQVALADIAFLAYAWFGVHWHVPATAMSAWLASVVAQVITIVVTITRGIFPAAEAADHGEPHRRQPPKDPAPESDTAKEDQGAE
jgi:hypothetical protein